MKVTVQISEVNVTEDEVLKDLKKIGTIQEEKEWKKLKWLFMICLLWYIQ